MATSAWAKGSLKWVPVVQADIACRLRGVGLGEELVTIEAAPDQPPMAEPDSATTFENTAVTINVLANDTAPGSPIDPTTVTVTTGPSNGTTSVNPTTGVVTYTPNNGFSGTDTFSYTVANTKGDESCPALVTITVVPVSDLKITMTGSPSPVTAGNNLTYTITLTDSGPSDAQNVQLTDSIPANTTFVSESQSSGPTFTVTNPAVGGTGTISGTTATLAAGGSATFTVVVHVSPSAVGGSNIVNTAMVSSPTDSTSPHSVTVTTPVVASAMLQINMTGSPSPVTAGNNLTYTITVTNSGASIFICTPFTVPGVKAKFVPFGSMIHSSSAVSCVPTRTGRFVKVKTSSSLKPDVRVNSICTFHGDTSGHKPGR